MQRFSKILAVFVAVSALAFMGFAAANLAGGPNWNAERKAVSDDYVFEYTEGETPTWAVKTRRKSSETQEIETVASSLKSLPAAVIAAQKHRAEYEKNEVKRLADLIPPVQTRLEQTKTLIDADLAALKKHGEDLSAALEQMNEQIDKVSMDGVATAHETQTKRSEADRRREDVFRLKSQLDEIQTDKFQILEQLRQLGDQLVRLNGVLDRLERRKAQLESSGSLSGQ